MTKFIALGVASNSPIPEELKAVFNSSQNYGAIHQPKDRKLPHAIEISMINTGYGGQAKIVVKETRDAIDRVLKKLNGAYNVITYAEPRSTLE